LLPWVEDDLVIVPWDDEVFLVPRCSIHRFCIPSQESPSYTDALALVCDGKARQKRIGKPKLPPDLEIFLELPEIRATVTAVEKPVLERHGKLTTIIKQAVTLDVGSNDHVFVGMKLQCTDHGSRLMRVTEIRKDSCTASSFDSIESDEPIRVGYKIKTATW
jgi:hypothetical protein